jgi:transcription elongation GreA/GreB family factor
MNKAFTKEEDDAPIVISARAPLPPDAINYVTPRGLGQLQDELKRLQAQRRTALDDPSPVEQRRQLTVVERRLTDLEARIGSAVLIATPTEAEDVVRFGARVQVRNDEEHERSFQIVGVDEADAALGLIGFASPVARALLGKRVGEVATVVTPRGTEELEVLSVSYEPS